MEIVIETSLAVSPIKDKDDKVIGFLHLARDVTEKKRYEQRLKELDKMKSAFVSNVSHELRTPLTAIKASADNLLDRLIGDLNGKQVSYLTRIKSNSDRLARLINDLLDLSTIEAGKIDLRPTNLSLGTLAKEAAESLRPVATEKLIDASRRLYGSCGYGLGRSRQGDPGAHQFDRQRIKVYPGAREGNDRGCEERRRLVADLGH